jgi:DNA processing protein
MNPDHHALLVLSRVPGIGSMRLRSLVSHFGNPAAVASSSGRSLLAVQGIERRTASAVMSYYRGAGAMEGRAFADAQLRRLERLGGTMVSWWDPGYPALLKKSDDPPPFLFILGALEACDAGAIAIVGTRSPSPYGIQLAEQFAATLGGFGITVVSGLARGIDTAAHAACVRLHHRTLAVIGSGLDIIYPSENSTLAQRILACGAIVTEFPLGTKPDAVNFPRRNRIVSGMTLGTLVVETGPGGGAMITAALALEQGREVFAVPSAVSRGTASGTNVLIKEGKAKLTESVDDILIELAPKLKAFITQGPGIQHVPVVHDLTLFERQIADALTDTPIPIDLLATRSGLTPAEALVHLLSLEFKGVVRQLPGKLFRRA